MKTRLPSLAGVLGGLAALHLGMAAGAQDGVSDQVCYAVEELGPVFYEGLGLQSLGINASGTVVGATPRWGGRKAFIYEKGIMSPLGDLGSGLSDARAVNARGFAVGGSQDRDLDYRAASFYKGTPSDLGAMPGEAWSWSWGVNEVGLAVGDVTVGGRYHAGAFHEGKVFDLGTLGWDTFANGVNDHGDIVGNGQLWENGPWQAFLSSDGEMTELPGLTEANQINNGGTICGAGQGADGYHGLLYRDGQVTDLGDFGSPVPWGWSDCYGLSDSGVAVGIATDADWNSWAFAWRNAREGLVNLNSRIPPELTVVLFLGSGVNSAGQITAYGYNYATWQGVEGYLLSPAKCAWG